MKEYKYKSPEESGYKKVKVDKQAWNKHFKYDGYKFTWKQSLEVYHHPEKGFIVERYHRLWQKVLLVLTYPLAVLVYGFANYKEVNMDTKKALKQKKYGGFVRDCVYSSSDIYEGLVKTIK
jgi:hypothetical protein